MPSSPQYLLTMPFTAMLCSELSTHPVDPTIVKRCLKLGADPFAKLDNGESVFFAIVLKAPDEESLGAWFAAAGNLQKRKWSDRVRNPLYDLLPSDKTAPQGDGFTLSTLKRLEAAGLDASRYDTPENPLLGRALKALVRGSNMVHHLLETYPNHAFQVPKWVHDRLGSGAQAKLAERALAAPVTDSRPRRSPGL